MTRQRLARRSVRLSTAVATVVILLVAAMAAREQGRPDLVGCRWTLGSIHADAADNDTHCAGHRAVESERDLRRHAEAQNDERRRL
jgi:hypothetical protein